MSRVGRAIFNVLGVVELVVDAYGFVAKLFKKKPKPVLRDEQDEEVIPLRRVTVRPPPLKAKRGP